MKKFFKNNWICLLSLLIFCVITIPKLLTHFPWYDEAHAWQLSNYMTLDNWISVLSREGHFIIWYLVLMPFAKLHFGYPYSMLIMNWLFYFLSLIVIWKKAPFNLITKLLITFSWISLNYFSIVARCYSIGLIGIVLLLSLYKKQLEKPLLYSLLLVFTANTSFLNTVAIIPLGFIFIHNLCNKASIIPKKQYIFSWVILASGATLWIFTFLNGYGYRELLGLHYPSIHHIFNFF